MSRHVVYSSDLGGLLCEHCGAREAVDLPCSAGALCRAIDAFSTAHAECRPSDTMRGRYAAAESIVDELRGRQHASRERSLRDVGAEIGVSWERVRQVEFVALAKVRAQLEALGLTAAEVLGYLDTLAPGHVEPAPVEFTDEERRRRKRAADRERRGRR